MATQESHSTPPHSSQRVMGSPLFDLTSAKSSALVTLPKRDCRFLQHHRTHCVLERGRAQGEGEGGGCSRRAKRGRRSKDVQVRPGIPAECMQQVAVVRGGGERLGGVSLTGPASSYFGDKSRISKLRCSRCGGLQAVVSTAARTHCLHSLVLGGLVNHCSFCCFLGLLRFFFHHWS